MKSEQGKAIPEGGTQLRSECSYRAAGGKGENSPLCLSVAFLNDRFVWVVREGGKYKSKESQQRKKDKRVREDKENGKRWPLRKREDDQQIEEAEEGEVVDADAADAASTAADQ